MMPMKATVLRVVPVLAAASFAAAPVSAPVTVWPGRVTTTRIHARTSGELSLRARATRCSLRIAVDGGATVSVRPKRPAVQYPVATVARGWHRLTVRAVSCTRGAVVEWLLKKRRAGGPGGAPTGTAKPTGSSNPFAGRRFYVDPDSNAARAESSYLAGGDATDARAIAKIAENPQARWFGGGNADPSAAVGSWVARAGAVGALPVLVAYGISGRECGGQSTGPGSPGAYEAWIDGFARGIGRAQAVVILEPDALPGLACGDAAAQQRTLSLLSYAVRTLSANPGTSVYLDAGHAGWQPTSVIAARLEAAGVADARGFSLNVSNFDSTAAEESYGNRVSALIGGKHFIVDTSRNGHGPAPDGQWCNPAGRGLGRPATTATGDPLADALFWIKPPGESDGACNGGPATGIWWPAYALGLAENASV